jgi:N-acetyl-anhydromuramyl-L-alanine amidase AmpD
MNGGGKHMKLESGTPVMILFKNGNLQQPFIIGTFNQTGNHKDYNDKGLLKKPGDTIEGYPFAQTSGHPNLITQTDANYEIKGAKNLQKAYSSPEFGDESADAPVAGIITINNSNGDSINYSQSHIRYVDGNEVRVTAGTNEQKTSKLLRNSIYHATRASLFGGAYSTPASQIERETSETAEEKDKKAKTGITQIVKITGQAVTGEAIPITYRAQSEKKLSELYLQAAKDHAAQVAARLQESSNLNKEFGNEISALPTDPNQAFSKYTPPIESPQISTNNYGERVTKDADGRDIKPKDLLVVMHETVISGNETIKMFQDPRREASYHTMIKRDGTVTQLVPFNQRAFGAGNSWFNGPNGSESEATTRGVPPSVNNFSVHIAFETPPDGNNNGASHSGYTSQQYTSAAYVISKLGAAPERIVTHKEVDRSGERSDPRSYDRSKLIAELNKFENRRTVNLGAGIK